MQNIFSKYAPLAEKAHQLSSQGEYPFGVVIEEMLSSTRAKINGKEVLLFGTNNYLGLSQSLNAKKAAAKTLERDGVGTTGSRIANGTFALHRKLEKELARVFGRRHGIIFSTGYQANLGMISGLVNKDDILFLDADCHASIYDGARLSGAQIIRFRHNSPEDLDKRLARLKDHAGSALIVTEGIYSMTGNVAPLKEFVKVAKKYNVALLVDEAHSFGVFGENGLGIAELQECAEDIDFIVGTFSKSLGTVGGYCVTNYNEIDFLRVASRPYMFTASLPPEIIASTLAALKELEEGHHLRERIAENAIHVHKGLKALGLNITPSATPIVGVFLDDIPQALAFWNGLLKRNVYVNLSLPPATPDSRPLLRVSVTAAHSSEEIDKALAAFQQTARELSKKKPA